MIVIHGAEHDSALKSYSLQREFAGTGIGVFAYEYGDEPWFKSVRGNFTKYMLAHSPENMREEGARPPG